MHSVLSSLFTAFLVVVAGTTAAGELLDGASQADVQDWLAQWNLKQAFGDYFERLQIDGDMLKYDLTKDQIDWTELPYATGVHVNKLFRILKNEAATAKTVRRRKLASSSSSSITPGLSILRDNARIALGVDGDVTVDRVGDGQLHIGADVDVEGTLNVADLDSITVSSRNTSFFDATVDTSVFIGDDPILIKRGIPVSKTFTTSADYQLEFDINPFEVTTNWGGIIHMTTEGNCCDYGQRIPFVLFNKGTTRLNVRMGSNSSGNAGVLTGSPLPLNAWTHVLVRAVNDTGEVWVNGSLVATCETDLRKPHDNVKVYMADPWHSPALAYLRNVRYQRISYHHSNFYNQFTDYDDEDSVDEIVAGLVDLTDEHSDVLDSLETTYWDRIMEAVPDNEQNWDVFIGDTPVKAKTSTPVTGDFRTGAEYELSMDIMPYGTQGSWSNIIHFTTTGKNCCDYGDRIPAIWFYANSNRLHIRSGSNTSNSQSGNFGFDPTISLPQGEWTNVRLLMVEDEGKVFYNDTYMGSITAPMRMPHDGVEVWMGDEANMDPKCYLKNVKYRIVSAYHASFYEASTQYDHDNVFNQHTSS